MAGIHHQALIATYPFQPALIYISSTGDLGAGSKITSTAQGVGAASPSRLVIAQIIWAIGGATTLSSATIGGISATIVGQCNGANAGMALIQAVVPTGTTANIVCNFAAPVARCSVSTFQMTGYVSAAASSADFPAGGGAANRSATITIPSRGVGLAVGMNSDAGLDIAFTNAVEMFDTQTVNERWAAGKQETQTQLTGYSITASDTRCVGAVAWS